MCKLYSTNQESHRISSRSPNDRQSQGRLVNCNGSDFFGHFPNAFFVLLFRAVKFFLCKFLGFISEQQRVYHSYSLLAADRSL